MEKFSRGERRGKRGGASSQPVLVGKSNALTNANNNIPNTVLKAFTDNTPSLPPASIHDDICHGGSSQNTLNDDKIAARFQQRKNLLRSACERYESSSAFRLLRIERMNLPLYRPIMKVTVSYCPIQKIASTSVWGLFNDIRREMTRKRVFGINVIKRNSEKDVLFVFVREPYGRLLSAYVDKLFSPNTFFWNFTGRYIVDNFRANASMKSRRCGHDVTFSEFLHFFTHMQLTGEGRDGHFVPAHDHCEICQRPYHYIGHLETLTQDINHILKSINAPVNCTKSYENSTILSDASMVLNTMRKEVQDCMDLDEACRRLWKKWQIRGLISKGRSFPLTREQTRDISLFDFVKIARQAARADDSHLRHGQREEALREAFSSVSVIEREEVRKLLWLDFELFGYESDPDSVFPKKPNTPAADFSYFDLYS
ncbi:hypothetical protein ACOMHN_065811 [Nucella lapillus]